MNPPDDKKQRDLLLRVRAERHIDQAHPGALPVEDLLHELQVHQVELEMQNETLRNAQRELEALHDRYLDLYDFAPVGYLTLNANGMIEEINLTAATLLGVERKDLLQRHFTSLIKPDDQNRWLTLFLTVMKQDGKGSVEVSMQRRDGAVFQALLDCQRKKVGADGAALRIALTDISERKQSEEALDRFFEQPLNLHLIAQLDGVIRRANTGWKVILGYRPEELEGTSFLDLVHPDDQAATLAELGKLAQGITTFRFENRYRHKKGGYRQLAWSANVAAGKQLIYAVASDITERKLAETALQESQQRWEFALEGAGDGVWDWNIQTGKAFYSPRYKAMYGYAEADIGDTADEWSKRIHPDDAPGVMAALQPYMDGKPGRVAVEFRVLCKDSSWQWTLGRGMVVSRDAKGKPLRMIGTNTDITRRKQQEEVDSFLSQAGSKAATEPFFDTLALFLARSLQMDYVCIDHLEDDGLNASTLAVWHDGHFEDNVTYALKDTPCGDVVGQQVCCFPASVCQLFPRDPALQVLRAESYIGVTLWSHSGQPIGLIAVIGRRQMTNRVQAEVTLQRIAPRAAGELERLNAENEIRTLNAELDQRVRARTADLEAANRSLNVAKIEAEAANIAKSAFLANMSHEIRTPMNGIVGMANILRREGVTPKQAQRLDTIDTSAQHLLSVINNILDLSKIEAGKLELEQAPVAIGSLLANVSSILSERAKAKGIHLLIETGHLPGNLVGDPARLQQAFLNYAANAIKFSEKGAVTLRAFTQEETADAVRVRFEVQDNGIGIAPETMSRLFNAFEQADNSMTRKYGGTGLGLAITRRLAALMGGEVGADSTAGVGSLFWFTVRLKKGAALLAPPTATEADAETLIRQRYARRRILVADDEPINREVAQMLLEAVDLVVDTAEDGAEAVSLAQKTSYAAVLMDMQMPRVNGVEATQQIRQLPGYRDTPIISMTANAFAEDKAECIAAGMTDILTKPFNPDQLFAILLRSWSQSRPHEQRPARPEDE